VLTGPFSSSALGFRMALHRPDLGDELREILAEDARRAIAIYADIVKVLEAPVAPSIERAA
jgi:hypothetical protein